MWVFCPDQDDCCSWVGDEVFPLMHFHLQMTLVNWMLGASLSSLSVVIIISCCNYPDDDGDYCLLLFSSEASLEAE